MRKTYDHWISCSDTPDQISIKIVVDTEKERSQLEEFDDVIVLGSYDRGVVAATNALTESVKTSPGDIIILISDDFYAPENWDTWIQQQFNEFHGCLLVRDGYQTGGCVTIPIIDHHCFVALNRIIYHPSYFHQFSDAELWHNIKELKMMKNFRRTKGSPIFEHRHWVNGKRKSDKFDNNGNSHGGVDTRNFAKRMKMPLKKRLK
jgi:hypothetical protein